MFDLFMVFICGFCTRFLVTFFTRFFLLFLFAFSFFMYTISSISSSLISSLVRYSPRYWLTTSKSKPLKSISDSTTISLISFALGWAIMLGYHFSTSIEPMITFLPFVSSLFLFLLNSSILAIVSSVDLDTCPTSASSATFLIIRLPNFERPIFGPTMAPMMGLTSGPTFSSTDFLWSLLVPLKIGIWLSFVFTFPLILFSWPVFSPA